MHRDLAGFDFDSSRADQPVVRQLATLALTDTVQNAVLICGPGTGKTHLATAIAVAGIAAQGTRALLLHGRSGQCAGEGKTGRQGRARIALLFHLHSKPY